MRKNVVFNYIGQIYSTFIGILILPMFIKYMGAEAYGLIGFFTLIQVWMGLLNMGLTPTLGREVARLKDKPIEHWRLITIVNTLEVVFFLVAILAGLALFLARDWVATGWLSFESLSIETVRTAVMVMAVTIAGRWFSSLSRSGINAYESQVWLNVVDIVINTLRSPGALLLVIWFDGNILAYFYYQGGLVIIETVLLHMKLHRLMPKCAARAERFSWVELCRVAPFAAGIAYTGIVWVLLTQVDKLLLSKVLTLAEYGYFTLVATIASGVVALSGPVSRAVLPRMTALLAEGKDSEMLVIYRRSTKFVVSIIAPITLMISAKPETIVFMWTGDATAASWVSGILPIFILGSGLITVLAFQYYLQYAHGVLKYHVAYNTFAVLFNVPLVVYFVFNFGAIGAAWVWLGFRLFSLLFWAPYVHRKFAPNMHSRWLFFDVAPPVLVSFLIIHSVDAAFDVGISNGRTELLFYFFTLTCVAIFVSLVVSMSSFLERLFGGLNPNVHN